MALTYIERRRGYGAIERNYNHGANGDVCVLRDHPADGMFWLGNVRALGTERPLLRRVLIESDSMEFYVTVQDAGRTGLLAGPFYSHADAIAAVPAARDMACAGDAWAHFYHFGTAGLPRGTAAKVVFPGLE